MRSDLSAVARRAKAERGLSLIEATIILGVVSILTAIMAPSVRNYVQGAQQAAAQKDVATIGMAIERFLLDVGEGWVVRDGRRLGSATDHAAPLHTAVNRIDLLVSDGNIPAVQTIRSAAGTPDWNAAADNATTVQDIDNFLVLNTPNGTGTNAYRTAATMDGDGNFDPNVGKTFNAPFAWRGSYLPGPVASDPWGNRYAVNVEYLARVPGAGPTGNVNDVLVISAGNNGIVESRYDTDGVSNANDIVYVLAGGTR